MEGDKEERKRENRHSWWDGGRLQHYDLWPPKVSVEVHKKSQRTWYAWFPLGEAELYIQGVGGKVEWWARQMQDWYDREKLWEPEDILERALNHHRSKKWNLIQFNHIPKRQGAQVTSGMDDPGGEKFGPFTSVWSKKIDNESRVPVL